MKYYLLESSLRYCQAEEVSNSMSSKYVAILTTPEWGRERDRGKRCHRGFLQKEKVAIG